jgi:hypothetical protein
MDFMALVEFIGFDIIFLGLLTILVCYVLRALWLSPAPFDLFSAAEQGWTDYRNYLQGCFDPADDCEPGGAARSRTSRTAQLVGMLLMAALLGMVVNVMGDRMLDSDLIVRNIPVPPVWYDDDDWHTWSLTKYNFLHPARVPSFWMPEDAIKTDALKSVGKLYTSEGIKNVIKNHLTDEDSAKALYQHAYARVMSIDNKPVVNALRYEYLAVKVLRVGLVELTVLLLVALIKLLKELINFGRTLTGRRRAAVPAYEPAGEAWSDEATLATEQAAGGATVAASHIERKATTETPAINSNGALKTGRARLARVILSLVLLCLMPLLFLKLWSAQSKRYDKKVLHTYLTLLADGKDVVLEPSPKPGLTPTPTATPTATPATDAKAILQRHQPRGEK